MIQSSQAANVELIAAITRATTFAICCVGGILAIYLGYKLYVRGITSHVDGSLRNKDWSVAMRATGPGVFLALFGMSILIYALRNPVRFRTETDESDKTSETVPIKQTPLVAKPEEVPKLAAPPSSDEPQTPIAKQPQQLRSHHVKTDTEINFFDGGSLTQPRVQSACDVALDLIGQKLKSPDLSEHDLRRLNLAEETISDLRKRAQ